jgi:hypothetical protein
MTVSDKKCGSRLGIFHRSFPVFTTKVVKTHETSHKSD